MKSVVRCCVTIVLMSALVAIAASAGNCRASAITQKSFASLQKEFEEWAHDLPPSATHELAVMRKMISSTPRARRAEALRKIASRTKWGSPERATAYYMCAWYGVNYKRCRDYLLTTMFWVEMGVHLSSEPFTWHEDTVDLLYDLYESNHDFVLLHELLIRGGDGAIAVVLNGVHTDALSTHPRGVLHAATISESGFDFALTVLTNRFHPDVGRAEVDKGVRTFKTYVSRVAADRQDPLNAVARKLLAERGQRVRGEVRVRVDGKVLETEPRATIRGGLVFVPAQMTFRRIGLWTESGGKGRLSVGWPDSDAITHFAPGSSTATYGPLHHVKRLPGKPFMCGGALMVPLRSMLCEKDSGSFLTSEWNSKTKTVAIHRSKKWLRWRLQRNRELLRSYPGHYGTPI